METKLSKQQKITLEVLSPSKWAMPYNNLRDEVARRLGLTELTASFKASLSRSLAGLKKRNLISLGGKNWSSWSAIGSSSRYAAITKNGRNAIAAN